MFCCRLGSFECVFVDIARVHGRTCLRKHTQMHVCTSPAGCCFCTGDFFFFFFFMDLPVLGHLYASLCMCVHLCILRMKVHPSIMWAWRSIQAHVILNQLLGSSLALHWSSSELIFQPSDILCVAWGNNRSCSHQMCYVINVTGSFAAHVMATLFHSQPAPTLYTYNTHTYTHTHTHSHALIFPVGNVYSGEATVFPAGSSYTVQLEHLDVSHIVHSQSYTWTLFFFSLAWPWLLRVLHFFFFFFLDRKSAVCCLSFIAPFDKPQNWHHTGWHRLRSRLY